MPTYVVKRTTPVLASVTVEAGSPQKAVEAALDAWLADARNAAMLAEPEVQPERPLLGGIVYYCSECGRRLNIVDGTAICSRCHFDLTGEDADRDAKEARERLYAAESPREGTEA